MSKDLLYLRQIIESLQSEQSFVHVTLLGHGGLVKWDDWGGAVHENATSQFWLIRLRNRQFLLTFFTTEKIPFGIDEGLNDFVTKREEGGGDHI